MLTGVPLKDTIRSHPSMMHKCFWYLVTDYCIDHFLFSCEDYLTVSCTDCGTSESCGTEPTDNYYPLEEGGSGIILRPSNGFVGLQYKS